MGFGFRGALVTAVALLPAGTGRAADDAPSYERDVRPILKTHCFHCHGEGGPPKGKLDLRLRRSAVAGGRSGPAVVPGKPDESPLLGRVVDGEMPPAEVKKRPTKAEVDVLRRWVAAGAPTARPEPEAIGKGPYFTAEERGWAFQPVRRPKVPAVKGRSARPSTPSSWPSWRRRASGSRPRPTG